LGKGATVKCMRCGYD